MPVLPLGLVRQILQVLLDQWPVLLRIFFRLRLLNRCAIPLGQTRKASCTCRVASWAIGAARAVPIPLPACALRTRCAFALPLPLTLPFALALAFALPLSLSLLPLPLALALAVAGHGGIRV